MSGTTPPETPVTDDPMMERQPSAHLPQMGDVLAGRYKIEGIIGRGGMGVVFVARHMELGNRVAVKVVIHGDERSAERFLREARTCARLSCENIVRVFDFGRLPSGYAYSVMEYLSGEDLAQVLTRGPLPVDTATRYLLDVCTALREAHSAGIIHRDLKPSNLFLCTRADGQPFIKVLDFGISKVAHRERDTSLLSLTATDAVLGSPLYMSPEQLQASKLVDARSDIWSLGVIMYELLCATPPFKATTFASAAISIATATPPSLRAAEPDVPVALENVVQRCLHKDPAQRFQDVDSLAAALAPFAGARPPVRSDTRRRAARWLAVCAALVAATISPSHHTSSPTNIAAVVSDPLPDRWMRSGSSPDDYDMGLDRNVRYSGQYSGYIRSERASDGFGTLMQEFSPEPYFGKRLKFSAYVKSEAITGWAGLWMRVDDREGKVLRFDNMYPRAIVGTHDWTHYSVVLDVPQDSALIACGILLNGAGSAWLDGLDFEVVDTTVATTSYRERAGLTPLDLN